MKSYSEVDHTLQGLINRDTQKQRMKSKMFAVGGFLLFVACAGFVCSVFDGRNVKYFTIRLQLSSNYGNSSALPHAGSAPNTLAKNHPVEVDESHHAVSTQKPIGTPKMSHGRISKPSAEHHEIPKSQISTVIPSKVGLDSSGASAKTTTNVKSEHKGAHAKSPLKKVLPKSTAPKPHQKQLAIGSTSWEIAQEDNFFDHMGEAHNVEEKRTLHKEHERSKAEDSSWSTEAAAEKHQIQRVLCKVMQRSPGIWAVSGPLLQFAEARKQAEEVYEAKKRRDAMERLAAKKYTEETFAAMDAHRQAIQKRSADGFKSMEAKELATEVEREDPHASAQVIAEKALKLLKVVLQGRRQQLPQVDSTLPPL